MHKKAKVMMIAVLCAALVGVAALFLSGHCLVIKGKLCTVNARTLDLRGKDLTVSEYTDICRKLPQCRIQWDVPLQGQYLPDDSTLVTMSHPTAADLDTLAFFPELDTIRVTACNDPAIILALQQRYPHCQLQYQLTVEAITMDQTTTRTVLRNVQNITDTLRCMPQLTDVNALSCQDTAALQALQQQYPGCRIIYNVPVGQEAFSSTARQITVQSISATDLEQALPYFYRLKAVKIVQPVEDPEPFRQLEQRHPDITFTYSFSVLGVTVSNWDSEIDLSGIAMENTEALEAALPYFHDLEKVDMCQCGISDKEMEALNQRHPETLFVWMVKIGRVFVRTDITYFMPHQYGIKLQEYQTKNMKYLTELICLDLGHQQITSTDFLAYMTKMQYLILADTEISDISGCANMPELKYAEFFLTSIHDFSPLLACKKLEDLNVSYCQPYDYTVFCQMKQLKRLWWCGIYGTERPEAMREALPDTILMFEGMSSTGNGWRQSPNYFAMRDILGMPYMTF